MSAFNSETAVMGRVMASLPITLGSVLAAKRRLAEAIAFVNGNKSKAFGDAEALVQRCFKIRSASRPIAVMRRLETIYSIMPKVIHQANTLFHPVSRADCTAVLGKVANAFTFDGGFHKPPTAKRGGTPNLALKGIYFCTPIISSKPPERMADLIVHEMAHFVGDASGPNKIGHAAGGGAAALNGTHQQMLRTAANYAWLAWLARLDKSQWLTNPG